MLLQGQKFTSEQVEKLAEKLKDVVGELVNEEGLPIVDIAEEAPADLESSSLREHPVLIEEPDVIPLASFSAEERQQRRIERDRILDMLEEEERREQRKGPELTKEQKEQILQKRKEAAKVEAEKLKRAKALQKKMGKALLRGMTEDREKQEKTKKQPQTQAATQNKPSKTVSFADFSPEKSTKAKQKTDSPRAQNMTIGSIPRVNAAGGQLPMKMQVIERFPSASAVVPSNADTKSLSRSPSSPESFPDNVFNNSQERSKKRDQDSDTDAEFAQEFAAEYFKKRGMIGEQASKFVAPSHDHHASPNEWNQPEVPLEATLSSPPPKPAISRFKSDRRSTSSTSLGSSVIPVSNSQTLQRAVRVGKLEGDLLVGADDSNSDEDENLQKSLQIVKNNVTPEAHSNPDTPDQPVRSMAHQVGPQPKPQEHSSSPKASRFRLSRSDLQPTEISHIEGSSQKLPSSSLSQSEHAATSNSSPHLTGSLSRIDASRSTEPNHPSSALLVIESPSFPSRNTTRLPTDQRRPVMTSIVRESGAVADPQSCLDPTSTQRISRFKAERS